METSRRVAIVGMGGIFPGSGTLDAFWTTILEGKDTSREVPDGRWFLDPDEAFKSPPPAPDRVYSRRGCFVEDFTLDPAGFHLEADFLERLDPMFHLALHAGRQAFQDAVTEGLDLRRVGVLLGNIVLPTDTSSALTREILGALMEEKIRGAAAPGPRFTMEPLNRYVAGLPAGVVARALGLGGGSLTLDAACASSLYAVKLAADELLSGRADAMLTGGLSRPDSLYTQMGFSQLRALSPTGHCRAFDERADGLVVGEGAGMFVLKRLEDALEAGDHIHAVLAGVGLSNDTGGNLLAPDTEGQLAAMRAAYAAAGWKPQDVDLIECHATGTSVGDAVEMKSLRALWKDGPGQRCVLGSVKSNVGHLLTGAAAAGLMKVLLALRARTLPPAANFSRPGPNLDLENGPFQILTEPRPWPRRDRDTPRRAAVSAFGLGGINGHLLLEEWVQETVENSNTPEIRAKVEVSVPAGLPVAVVGMEACFGSWKTLNALQERVLDGSRTPDLPLPRWWGAETSQGFARAFPDLPFAGYFLDEFQIPLDAFRIPPTELEEMLPQQLLMLKVAAGAIAAAGLDQNLGPGAGVFVGIGLDQNATNFHLRWSMADRARAWNQKAGLGCSGEALAGWQQALREAVSPALTANRTMGALGGIVASRIARQFRISGPSHTISSEETSGLRALECAVRALQNRELDLALVGAVDLAGDVRAVVGMHAGRQFSASGRIRPFDAAADGTLPGEGAAAVVLKRLDQARGDGDRIHAVITGLGVASGGGVDRLVPEAETYTTAIRRAHQEAGIQPTDVGYLEAHGSGHAGEDRMEAGALASVYGRDARGSGPVIGSVKAAIGHAGAAAGMASFIQACLCLEHRTFPALGDLDQPLEDLEGAGLSFLEGPAPWPQTPGHATRRAGISAFSVDGNCVHVILEESGDAAEGTGRTSPSPVRCDPPPASHSGFLRVEVGRRDLEVPMPRLRAQEPHRDAFPGREARIQKAGVVDRAPAIATRPEAPILSELLDRHVSVDLARHRAHEAFLRLSGRYSDTLAAAATFHNTLLADLARDHGGIPDVPAPGLEEARLPDLPADPSDPDSAPAFNRAACLEFAIGSMGKVLGSDYASVDDHPTRVRLPDEPLMLVDRIVLLEGKPRSLGSGRVVTEHDIQPGAWYLDSGRIPTSIAVEAGQADLFLSGYLGIDFRTRGLAVYRLLDAVVTFHQGLPAPGGVIRYDIRIDHFFRQGNTHLFRFNFDATLNGEPLLTMREGCAGFFTPTELEAGKGLVHTELDRKARPGVWPENWTPPVPMAVESYDQRHLDALRDGDLPACFGPAFEGLDLHRPLTLPGGRMRILHRVPRLDPGGGRFGIGLIRAEIDIHPGDWFLDCHFVDDPVMPGTLMYECSLHALRILLLRMGWVGEETEVVAEPVPGVASRLKCRGQVIESTTTAAFEVTLKEIGFHPDPYALADTVMFADGRAIVEMTNMSLRLKGLTQERLEEVWAHRTRIEAAPREPLFDRDRILAFAVGKPSEAFGAAYKPFDEGRFIARLPGPPFQFLDRILRIENAEAWNMRPGGVVEAEYDVPPDAWYFTSNRQATLPFTVLLETALQSCGWLAAYLGSALSSKTDLRFRNLGGSATQHAAVDPGAGTLTTRVQNTRISRSGNMILQNYDFEVRNSQGRVYSGNTYFGFFEDEALRSQVGIRDAQRYAPTEEDVATTPGFEYPPEAPFPDRRFRMVDRLDVFAPRGGPLGKGFVQGSARVDAEAWFFKAHFHQDPVWPGSLGLESFLQLLKVVAARRWGHTPETRFETVALGETHSWVYRGQVLPHDAEVVVEASITRMDDRNRLILADGFLMIDGRIIYQMNDFGLRMASDG